MTLKKQSAMTIHPLRARHGQSIFLGFMADTPERRRASYPFVSSLPLFWPRCLEALMPGLRRPAEDDLEEAFCDDDDPSSPRHGQSIFFIAACNWVMFSSRAQYALLSSSTFSPLPLPVPPLPDTCQRQEINRQCQPQILDQSTSGSVCNRPPTAGRKAPTMVWTCTSCKS
jgi:hypothetical protein